MGIPKEENQRIRKMLEGMILGVRNKRDCIYISREISTYEVLGYSVSDLEEELFYKKERWLVDLMPN